MTGCGDEEDSEERLDVCHVENPSVEVQLTDAQGNAIDVPEVSYTVDDGMEQIASCDVGQCFIFAYPGANIAVTGTYGVCVVSETVMGEGGSGCTGPEPALLTLTFQPTCVADRTTGSGAKIFFFRPLHYR